VLEGTTRGSDAHMVWTGPEWQSVCTGHDHTMVLLFEMTRREL
jgi:hypothetical protein